MPITIPNYNAGYNADYNAKYNDNYNANYNTEYNAISVPSYITENTPKKDLDLASAILSQTTTMTIDNYNQFWQQPLPIDVPYEAI
jgi:hypothetical protein